MIQVQWQARRSPLVCAAVVGIGPVATALAQRLLRNPDESLSALSGVHAPGLVVAMGEPDALPWVNDALWLGRAAPGLYLPTALSPSVPVDWFERALRAGPAVGIHGPLAYLPDRAMVLSLSNALPISRTVLAGIGAAS